LSGFGHLAHYTALQTASGPSNWHDVMNRFDGLNFFVEPIYAEETDAQAIGDSAR
jgi:hypothetical protein